ncbi:uncharacterized protein LOC106774809, partial [Vigna radiata var. radiata]|uniref:Uncharacterized protein LOC106774809 n=1 Tax=Vigna radiata var. radiata TaxID=3916 RepID=A0A3Q0FGA9_VIGRR
LVIGSYTIGNSHHTTFVFRFFCIIFLSFPIPLFFFFLTPISLPIFSSNSNFSSLMARVAIAVVFVAAVILALSATSVTARPCRTFIISSYSFRNPNSNTFATITEIRSFTPIFVTDKRSSYDVFFPHALPQQERVNPRAPLGFASAYDFSSLRDRTKDILSVALALLFGVGCGALTAATMYLVWSVFPIRHHAAAYDDFSSDEEIESPKKLGYVKIPAPDTVAAAQTPAKGSV